MTKRRSFGSFSLSAAGLVAAGALSAPAAGQTAAEHAAHHPGSSPPATAGRVQAPAPQPSPPAVEAEGTTGGSRAMGGMEQMMGGERGEGMHGRSTPLYPGLMALPQLGTLERHRLASEADARIHQGLAQIEGASAEAERAGTPQQRQAAADQMREGLSSYDSGVAARNVLDGRQAPQAVALNWFRTSLNLPATGAQHGGATSWFGLTPAHLFFMTILLLVAAGLLALQMLRLKRVRDLVTTAGKRSAGAVPAQRPAAVAVADLSARAQLPSAEPATAAPAMTLPFSNAPDVGGTALRRPKIWSGELRVAQIVRETPTVETFRLIEPASDRLPFDFLPGQFLQVEVEAEPGKTARRSYTIASSPTQRAYVEVTVKRETEGVVSRYLHDNVEVGDRLKVSGPFGVFTFTGSDADSIVLIAGGVGITPMMSVLRYLTDTAWPGEIFFVYGARSTEEFIFREEIEQLERRHPRLHVLATMQRSPGTVWLGPEGSVTKELLQAAVPEIASRRIHLCGPPPMMAAVKSMLLELGVPEAQIHSEAFGPASLPPENAPVARSDTPAEPGTPAAATRPEVAQTTITFSVAGVSAPLPSDQSVLEAAEGAGVEIPYQCRVGVCGVCVTRLLEGDVSMAVEIGLDPADKAQGYVLACQAKSTGGPLVVEA